MTTPNSGLMAYESAGSGRAIVFLHGFPFTRAQWLNHLQLFANFGRVIVPDLPGFGESERQEEPSVPQMAKALFELLNALDVRGQVVVAGSSLGGYVAMEFFRQYPNRVRALGLFSTRAEADSEEQLLTRRKTEQQLRREGLEPLLPVFSERLLAQRNLSPDSPMRGYVEKLIRENMHAAEGLADSMQAMAQRNDAMTLLPEVNVPALLIGGTEDRLLPIQTMMAMAAIIRQSRFVELPECGHMVNIEQPQAFEAACTEFFREVGL